MESGKQPNQDTVNFFNLDKPYRVALITMVSIVTFFIVAEFWDNRAQRNDIHKLAISIEESLSQIRLIQQKDLFQDEQIKGLQEKDKEHDRQIEEIKKKIK